MTHQTLIGEPEEGPESVRVRSERIVDAYIHDDLLKEIFMQSLATTKKAWGDFTCKHCNRAQRHLVDIPDAMASLKALQILMDQTKGRPDVAKQEAQEQFIFQRNVYLEDDPEGHPV